MTITVRGHRRVAVTLACAALIIAAGATGAGAGMRTDTTAAGATGPSATITKITGGTGKAFLGEATPPDLKADGYVQREQAAAGTATSYAATGALTGDGRWTFAPSASAPYTTRVLVRAPAKKSKFSGNVIVEWLNVSGGVDAGPEWTSTAEQIVRAGDAWVGVSAQRIGVEGGPVLTKVDIPGNEDAGKGLKAIDPARYGTLVHPGDGYAFDIYTQVARAVRSGAVLGVKPRHVIAAGESQSAFALVTYFNGVQPLTHVFDGFFVHSRGAIGLPLVEPGKYADIAGAISGTPTILRTDQKVPVLDIQTETDVVGILNSIAARQPDTDHFRLWEVAGTAHADKHLTGTAAQYFDCGLPINNGPLHIVAKAALRALTTWVDTGKAPVTAPRIDVTPGASPRIQRDADGIASGGIRTPPVDVPVSILSGAPGPKSSSICILSGSEAPMPAGRIAQLYPTRADYLKKYRAATNAAIKAGFVLPQDRAALLAFAQPALVTG